MCNGVDIFVFIFLNVYFVVNPCWGYSFLWIAWKSVDIICQGYVWSTGLTSVFFAFNANSEIPIQFVIVFILCVWINSFVACVKPVIIHWNRVKGSETYTFNVPKCHLDATIFLPLRLSCTLTLQMTIKMNYFKQKYFLAGFLSWLNRSTHNGILTTASVTLQSTPFDSHREILSKFHYFYNCLYRSCILCTTTWSKKHFFRYLISIRICLHHYFFILITHKYSLNPELRSRTTP